MIARLRKRHRWLITALAVLVPVLFAAALTLRREVAAVPAPPGAGPAHDHGNP